MRNLPLLAAFAPMLLLPAVSATLERRRQRDMPYTDSCRSRWERQAANFAARKVN